MPVPGGRRGLRSSVTRRDAAWFGDRGPIGFVGDVVGCFWGSRECLDEETLDEGVWPGRCTLAGGCSISACYQTGSQEQVYSPAAVSRVLLRRIGHRTGVALSVVPRVVVGDIAPLECCSRIHDVQRIPRVRDRGPTLAPSLVTLQVLLMLVLVRTQQRQHLLRYPPTPSLQRRNTRRHLTAAVCELSGTHLRPTTLGLRRTDDQGRLESCDYDYALDTAVFVLYSTLLRQ